MATSPIPTPAILASTVYSRLPDQPEVLVVCADGAERETYRGIFEMRGLRTVLASDCRTGLQTAMKNDTVFALIVGQQRDAYTGVLINALRSRRPQPDVWLIGNPFHLCLSEIVLRHKVAVLPAATTPDQFEHMIFT